MTDTEKALRDALAVMAEVLDVPAGQVQERSDRALAVRATIQHILSPGADIGMHVAVLADYIARRQITEGTC